MYKSTFKKAFSDILPKSTDEEFAHKILNAADRQKPRARHRKAVVLPIAAAIVAIGTVTASAAGGLDLFGAFRSYFSQRTERTAADPSETAPYAADLSAAGMTKYDKAFDAGEYTVKLNGMIADSRYAYLSFDVTYRDKKYFDGGEVAEKYREGSPVIFFEDRKTDNSIAIHTTSWGEPIAENGATVSYVVYFAGDFMPDPETGEYPFALTLTCANDPSFIAGECEILANFPVELSVPHAQERTVPVDGTIPVSYKRTSTLKEVSFGPLSISLRFDNDNFYADYIRSDSSRIKLKMEDGTELDLSYQNSRMFHEEPAFNRSTQDFMNRETAAVKAARAEKEPAETTLPTDETPTESGGACVLQLGYGTAIDPAEITEIEIFGNTFPVK